jgi:ADP-ribosylglycohydrolase
MDEKTYITKLYSGILGKIIGVYLGRPFEGWSYDQIIDRLGEINYYVHDKLGLPLVVTDDDISGTFTFLRAIPDFGYSYNVTPEQIGYTWLNYLIENKTVLWWGGLGNSTEHTAYLRLKKGVIPPKSGSIETNGKVVAEQIGAQIFIDGWAMICPGDPEKAVFLAKKAASVSHDGEAIHGAQVVAAIEAQAFVENNTNKLLDIATSFIPNDSIIYRLIQDVREWHEIEADWRKTRELIVANYGYDRYGGNCHIVPNHALIHLGLLYGADSFQKTLMITNTSGWDTDCNSGNIGCIMGIKNGLAGLSEVDWRGPIADLLFLPTVDGGRSITNAVSETFHIFNVYQKIHLKPPIHPKSHARYHFELPGSLQGFSIDNETKAELENLPGNSIMGERSLGVHIKKMNKNENITIKTPTFISPGDLDIQGYSLFASPTIYPGQVVHARLKADSSNTCPASVELLITAYGEEDQLEEMVSNQSILTPGDECIIDWELSYFQQLTNKPIAEIGFRVKSNDLLSGYIYLDYLTWDGSPKVIYNRPIHKGVAWKKAWVNAVDYFETNTETFRIINNEGRGFLIHGTQEWTDYQVNADVTPHLVRHAGLAARFQGLLRYYAFLLSDDGKVRLVKMDSQEITLAERDQGWRFGEGANLSIKVEQNRIICYWDGFLVFDVIDNHNPLLNGAIALVVDEGRSATQGVSIYPI